MSPSTKKNLNRIKSGIFSRGVALARVSVTAGARAASHAVGNLFSNEAEKADRFRDLMVTQAGALARELGQLKGSLMKVGQMLSMYGEHFLPPEANELLKSLQNQSPPLRWKEIQKVIQKQLPPERLQELEIDPEPLASASLGQVHRARRKSDGRALAMKIQYPGVDRAIEGDLKALQSILSVAKLIPKGPRYDELFREVRMMLHQEVDYTKELETTREFKEKLATDSRFIVPEVFPEYSTRRILTTSLEEGVAVDGPEVQSLSQERRNALALAAMQLYFREVFEWGAVQTDPHFGNYRIRLGEGGAADQMVLLDFGAVRKPPKAFLNPYYELIRGAHQRDLDRLIRGAEGLGFIRPEDSEEQKRVFSELCFLITEPFFSPEIPGVPAELFDSDGAYRFGESDLLKRVARKAGEFGLAFRFRTPPRELVFLDRKLGGLFVFVSVLKARIRCREAVDSFIFEKLR